MVSTKERIIAQREIATEWYILSTRPVLYLPLYRLRGASLLSADGHGHICTPTSVLPTLQGGIFNGTSSKINCGSHGNIDLDTFSWEAWFKTTTGQNGGILDKGPTNTSSYYQRHALQWNGADTLNAIVGNSGATDYYIVTEPGLSLNKWYHAVMTFDPAGKLILYLQGTPVGDISAGTPRDVSANSFMVGVADRSAGNKEYFAGVEGEVRIYDRVLSGVEVSDNCMATAWRYV